MQSYTFFLILHSISRGVAQPGLEYTSGGRVVVRSNRITPTEKLKALTMYFVGAFSIWFSMNDIRGKITTLYYFLLIPADHINDLPFSVV